jgi:midasin (ATPase involved in ribosome maturation)
MMTKGVTVREAFMEKVREEMGEITQISRKDATSVASKHGLPVPNWLFNDATMRVGRGIYSLTGPVANPAPKKGLVKIQSDVPVLSSDEAMKALSTFKQYENGPESAVSMAASAVSHSEVSLIPEKKKGYVPFGNFSDVRSIVKSRKFYTDYITGLSGNGKTLMVEQVCAAEKRELIRVNVTIETDEDDLLGGFRLVDGHTVWQDGPVIIAMERGAILLLDEVDLGSNKMMCLQPVLEGGSIFLKKINRMVHPKAGFNVFATANTKGKGSEDGRFIGTNVMNEALLDRFSVTMEQEYPPQKTETKILTNVLAASEIEDKEFVEKLVTWADVIRKSFFEGALSEIISTRRLVHICEAFAIFNKNRMKAIELCLNRFDADTKVAFTDLYKKVDETIDPPAEGAAEAVKVPEEVAF